LRLVDEQPHRSATITSIEATRGSIFLVVVMASSWRVQLCPTNALVTGDCHVEVNMGTAGRHVKPGYIRGTSIGRSAAAAVNQAAFWIDLLLLQKHSGQRGLPARVAPRMLMGVYASKRSVALNHNGPPSILTAAIPLSKKKAPIARASFMGWLAANLAATNAPTSVPSA
jgi:hypothetical protein